MEADFLSYLDEFLFFLNRLIYFNLWLVTNNCDVITGNGAETCDSVQEARSINNTDKDQRQSTKDAAFERHPLIEIVPDATEGGVDVDEEVSFISARVSQLDLDLPVISVQIASPVVMSPSEKEGTLCSAMEKYAHAWTGNFDIEEQTESETEVNDGRKSDGICQQERPDVDSANMGDDDNRPLSPTDYTLEDESDVIQADAEDAFHPILLDCRVPSPSEFSLLTESAEENELNRLTHTAIPDDVFAIPDPSPSSTEMNIYLAMQYDQFACSHHPDSTNDSAGMSGTNT